MYRILVLLTLPPDQIAHSEIFETRLRVDRENGTGYVEVQGRRISFTSASGYGDAGIQSLLLFTETASVPGLRMEDDQLVYQSPDERVVCGHLGRSRFLGLPRLFLNGLCRVDSHLRRIRGKPHLVVEFHTGPGGETGSTAGSSLRRPQPAS